ncbi:hypothetical protein [Roseiconus lacunae]|uniref:hypothetical protein n=1 Tax=Roseiconus lacunae TaxID=2605694 RepID=UPI001E4CBD0E|nr:hypothetical protein [Roseiconus lacunae]MCD0457912.1 hypothetical protein [Roseiconus lacunae]
METEISHNANLALGKFLSGNKVAAYRDAKALSHELDKYEYFTAYNKLEHELCTYSESLGISKMDQMTQAQRKKVGNCFKRAENYWEDNQPEDAMKELGKIRSFVDKQLPDPNHALGNRLALLDDPPNYVTDRTIQFARNSALSARKLVDQSKYKEAFAIVEQAEQRIRDDWDDDWDVDIAAIILGLQHQKADI